MPKKQSKENFNLLSELDKIKSKMENVYIDSINERIAALEMNLENIDKQIELLNSEIEELKIQADKAYENKNYSLYASFRRTIASRLDLIKKLYESRADLEGILQKYYDVLLSTEFKYYEYKLKTVKDLYKDSIDNTTSALIKNFILKLSQQDINTNKKSEGSSQKGELILEDEEVDLPDEFKNL